MIFKVILFILFSLMIIGFIALGVWRLYKYNEEARAVKNRYYDKYSYLNMSDEEQKETMAKYNEELVKIRKYKIFPIVSFAIAGLSIFLLIFIPGNIHQVNTGEVAVVRHLGKVSGYREPGIYWDFYMTNDYEKYDTTVRQLEVETQTYSNDNQIIGVNMTVQYQIDSQRVEDIATIYGSINKLETKIGSVVLDKTKTVFARNTATNVINNRSEITSEISQNISDAVNNNYYINIKSILLTNIDFTDDFEAAVAQKVAAAQDAEKAENEARKAEVEAEAAKKVAILNAEAQLEKTKKEAEAKLYAAEQDAKAQLLLAQAEANATKLKAIEVARMVGFDITESQDADGNIVYNIDFGNPTTAEEITSRDTRIKLLTSYLEYVQYLETWDGTLPVTLVGDDTAAVVIPSNN